VLLVVDHDICNGLNPMDKCCGGDSAGMLFVVSCLRELDDKLEPKS